MRWRIMVEAEEKRVIKGVFIEEVALEQRRGVCLEDVCRENSISG